MGNSLLEPLSLSWFLSILHVSKFNQMVTIGEKVISYEAKNIMGKVFCPVHMTSCSVLMKKRVRTFHDTSLRHFVNSHLMVSIGSYSRH